MTVEGFEHLPGHPLRPGAITIPAAERELLAEVLRGPVVAGDGLHPLHAYIVAQRGIGESIEDLCTLADFPIEDGPMMGSLQIELHGSMHADTEYRIEGEVVDMLRKHGSLRGPFDLLTYRERVLDPAGVMVAELTNTFVLFRKDTSD